MTSAVAPKTSAVSTQPSTDDTNLRILALKESAKQFLGCGFDRRAPDQKAKMSVMDINDSDIKITNYVARYVIEMGTNGSIVSRGLKRKLGLEIELSETLKFKLQNASEKKTKTENTTYVCALGYFESMHCALNRYMPLRGNVNKGDACVVSGRIYLGYCVFFTVETEETQDAKDNHLTGIISLSFKNWLIGLGMEADQINNDLEQRIIKRITIHAEGYGYSPTIPLQETNENFERILKCIDAVKDEFRKASAQIQMCPYSINPNEDLCSYHQIEFIANTAPPYPDLPPMPKISNSISSGVFKRLAENILKSCEPSRKTELKSVLQGARLEKMLEEIFNVFSKTGVEKPASSKTAPYTMVIGPTGAGKSLMIGYLLGHPIVKVAMPTKIPGRIRELLGLPTGTGVPVVGHHLSMTRGCSVYENYLDTAGFFDTGNEERDICNAAAINIMAQLYNPTRLICVIESGSFSARAKVFFDILDKLKRAIRFPTSGVIPPSILFAIREKNEAECLELINEAIDRLEGQLDPGIWTAFQQTVAAVKGTVAAIVHNTDPNADYDPTEELKDRLNMSLQLTKQNVIVPNYDDNKMKKRIEEWQQSGLGDISSSFDMENLVTGGFGKFKEVLCVTVAYFRTTYAYLQHLKTNISKLTASLNEKKALKLDLMEAKDNNAIVAIIGKAQNRRHDQLDALNSKKVKMEADRKDLLQKRQVLVNDESVTFLRTLKSDEPILSRILLFRERSYRFHYKGIPLVHTKKQHEIGHFFDEKHDPNSEGKYSYSIEYKPHFWWIWGEKGEAAIELYVKKKDHPETFTEIDGELEELNEELKTVEEEISQLSATLAGGKSDVIKSLEKEISEIDEKLFIHEKACEKTQEVLDENKSFLKVIYKIIQSSRTIRWTDIQIKNFDFFLKNFKEYLESE